MDAPEENNPGFEKFRETFSRSMAEGLFAIAADKADFKESPTISFWQDLAGNLINRMCHLPPETVSLELTLPGRGELERIVQVAPPMVGGEYLSQSTLADILNDLAVWIETEAGKMGGPARFLDERAPKWRKVGRVCLHLAENRNDQARPFAFMATYTSGFGAEGNLRHVPLGKALEEYSGAGNRNALVNLLSPLDRGGKACPWLGEMVDSGGVFRPTAWTAGKAYRFLLDAEVLEEAGLVIRIPDWWKSRPRPKVRVTVGQKLGSSIGASELVDFDLTLALGDRTLSAKEIENLLAGGENLVSVKGSWVEIDREKLMEALDHWNGLKDIYPSGGVPFAQAMRLLAGAPANLKFSDKGEAIGSWTDFVAGKDLSELLERLRGAETTFPAGSASPIDGDLRPYQLRGLEWLRTITALGLGGCLADDMGLGKTVQVLALLALNKVNTTKTAAHRKSRRQNTPSLLVVPASLLGNWRQEAKKFTPGLRLGFLHPSETPRAELDKIAGDPEKYLSSRDLVITTYSMVSRMQWLGKIEWNMVILDEAQAIKNPDTTQTRAVKKLKGRAKLALTGTPVENRLGDLWSIFDFLNPGLLGSAGAFAAFMRNSGGYGPVRRLVAPYILRRLKTDKSIIDDLPDKTETVRYCGLTTLQAKAYSGIVENMKKVLAGADGIARKGLILSTILSLKQVCDHPALHTGTLDFEKSHSGKFERLSEICEELAERQEKALVFTQFSEMIPGIQSHLEKVFGSPGLILHGKTPVGKRRELVERFQSEDGPPFFVLSLKAGGTGLNLTAASHVIHFDRWWNPAVENQATDRAFRIGQKRPVLVHKFVTSGTIEEKIDAMLVEKGRMADEILAGAGEINLTELSDAEVINLVSLDISKASDEE